MNEPFSLKYRDSKTETPRSPGWDRIHDFLKGWGWGYHGPGDLDAMVVFDYDLRKKGITNWLTIGEELQNKIVEEVRKEREEYRKKLANSPPLAKFDTFAFPKIKEPFPTIDLNTICGITLPKGE